MSNEIEIYEKPVEVDEAMEGEEKTVILIGEPSDYGDTKGEFVYRFVGKYPDEVFLKAIELSGGNMTRAAKLVGVSYTTLKRRMHSSPTFAEKVREIREIKIDFAEDVLWGHIEEHNLLATMFYLKTIGKNRGYTTQTVIVGDKDKPVNINLNIGGKLSDDEYS